MRRADRAHRRAPPAVGNCRRRGDCGLPHERDVRPRLARPGRGGGRPKIAELLGLPLAASEPLQDSATRPARSSSRTRTRSSPAGYDYYVHTADRGQRTWTAMVYLNQPAEGGATRFKSIGKTVQPETGKLLAVEQSAARRQAEPGDPAPGHEGPPRHQVHPDEVVSGASGRRLAAQQVVGRAQRQREDRERRIGPAAGLGTASFRRHRDCRCRAPRPQPSVTPCRDRRPCASFPCGDSRRADARRDQWIARPGAERPLSQSAFSTRPSPSRAVSRPNASTNADTVALSCCPAGASRA